MRHQEKSKEGTVGTIVINGQELTWSLQALSQHTIIQHENNRTKKEYKMMQRGKTKYRDRAIESQNTSQMRLKARKARTDVLQTLGYHRQARVLYMAELSGIPRQN